MSIYMLKLVQKGMEARENKHKNKFNFLPVTKTCDKKKLAVFCNKQTKFVIEK